MKNRWCLVVIAMFLNMNLWGQNYSLFSPDKNIHLEIKQSKKRVSATLYKGGVALVQNIQTGLTINKKAFDSFQVIESQNKSFHEIWAPVWGKQQQIKNEYNELILILEETGNDKRKMEIVFRTCNDGIALRYKIPEQKNLKHLVINQDLTCFGVKGSSVFWAPNGEHPNIGPVQVSELKKETNRKKSFQTPLVLDMGNENYLAIHEAAVFDLSYSLLKPKGKNKFGFQMAHSETKAPAKTPWRVFMTGNAPGDLLESNVLYNLNPPCAIDDPSWIKPGVSLWDWRALGASTDHFIYAANQESYIRFIDFAAEKEIEYVLFDANWLSDKGPFYSKEGMDIPGLIKYAEKKEVGILLYLDRRRPSGNNNWDLEEVLKTWNKWGVKGIKYGFLRSECNGRQELVRRTREITELCAKYKMLVNFHDNPVPPGGDSRTWPNLVTREYCHAQSDARRAFQPETFVTAAFVNGVSGALDMNNGYFDLNSAEKRAKVGEPIPSTAVGEAARAFIIFSGLVVLPDHPDAYRAKDDLFQFMAQIQGSWDETRVLQGEIGKYIVVARRKGDVWMVGAATNEKSREVRLNFDFLEPGRHKAKFYADGENASAYDDKESYSVTSGTVSINDKYIIKMAPGGGHCIIINSK